MENQTQYDKILCRKAMAKDIDGLQKFLIEHGKNKWNYLPIKQVKRHISSIQTHAVHAFVCEANGHYLGFLSFYYNLPRHCQIYENNDLHKAAYLCEIVVHKNLVRKGIGTELIDTLKTYLAADEVQSLYAERHSENSASSALMRKAGFRIIDEYDDPERRVEGSRRTTVLRAAL